MAFSSTNAVLLGLRSQLWSCRITILSPWQICLVAFVWNTQLHYLLITMFLFSVLSSYSMKHMEAFISFSSSSFSHFSAQQAGPVKSWCLPGVTPRTRESWSWPQRKRWLRHSEARASCRCWKVLEPSDLRVLRGWWLLPRRHGVKPWESQASGG